MLIGFDGANIQQFPDIPAVSVDFLMRRSVRAPLAAERLVPILLVASLAAEGKQNVGLLLLDEPRLHELVERDEVQLRERRVVEYAEMAVLRHQIVGSCGKGAVHELVIVGVCRDDAHAEVRVNQLYVLLVEQQHDHVLGHGRSNLLFQNLLILVQYLVRHAERVLPREECVPYRTIGATVRDNLQQTVRVNHYGIHAAYYLL